MAIQETEMGLIDFIFACLIGGGAAYLLYRSLWKSKGCAGCSLYSDDCEKNMNSRH